MMWRLVVLAVAALTGAQAQALPVYGFSRLHLQQFDVSGARVEFFRPEGWNEATHTALGSATKLGTDDPVQAIVGSPVPAQNSFTQQGEKGEYARADGRLTSDPRSLHLSGLTLVAGALLGGMDTWSRATALYELFFSVQQLDDAEPIVFSFEALPVFLGQAKGPNDHVLSYVEVTLDLYDAGGSIFSWNPCGNDEACASVKPGFDLAITGPRSDPFDLSFGNRVSCDGPCTDLKATAGFERYSIGVDDSHALGGFAGWTLGGRFVARAVAGVSNVPEPQTLWLVGVGLPVWRLRLCRWPQRA